MANFLKELSNNKSQPYRRAYIKRRLLSTGLFESEWLEITEDIKKWGTVVQKIDDIRQGKIKFSPTSMIIANDTGKYNPEDNESSLWFGFASQQRTLLKIEAGFKAQTLGDDGIYINSETPNSFWDAATYDENDWDEDSKIFTGIIQGDININDKNEVNLKIMPVNQIFRDFPARNILGFTSTGILASQFVEMIRDQTDGAGEYIFRPFFDDTTSSWNIETTTSTYIDLNTTTADEVISKSVWDIIEKLAEAQNFVAYPDTDNVFNFVDKNAIVSSTSYNFNGVGSSDREYGIQIRTLDFWGFRQSKYYSRVQVKHDSADTSTSYELREATFAVAGGNSPWNFGHRTLNITNTWLDASTASIIADAVFNNVSSAKKELIFSSSFVPHLNVNDRLAVTYDSNPVNVDSLWDLNDWADSAGAAETGFELVWDPFTGNAINLSGSEYRPLSISIDLDKLSTKIISKEV